MGSGQNGVNEQVCVERIADNRYKKSIKINKTVEKNV